MRLNRHFLLKKVIKLAEKTNIDLTASSPLNALDLLRWPGVLEKNTLDPETINKPLLKLIDQTLDIVIDTRLREGLKIKKMLTERCVKIKKIVGGYQLIIIIKDGSFLYAVLVCLIAPYFLCMKKQYSIQITIGYPDCCRVL